MVIRSGLRVDKQSPPEVVGRISLGLNNIPLRGYIHELGFGEWVGKTRPDKITSAADYLTEQWTEVLKNHEESHEEVIDFAYAFVWRRDGKRMINFFRGDLNCRAWYSNSTLTGWTTNNGIIVPDAISTRGDRITIMGIEETYRQRTPSREDFIKNPPKIKNLPLELDI